MQEKDITILIKKIVAPYAQNKEELKSFSEKTDFIKDLEVNSANLVDIVLDVEDEFDIEIDNDSMSGMHTVGDAKNIILGKMAAK